MQVLIYLMFLLLFIPYNALSQINISGKVTNKKGDPLIFANVALTGSFDGASTDSDGEFIFRTHKKGKQKLAVSYIGYETYNKEIFIQEEDLIIIVVLKPLQNKIEDIIITAGAFEASDEKRTVILRSNDIGTTAGAMGDVSGAVETLPGTQVVGESNGLFVRGGSGAETKVIIDEMVVQNPYYSPVPDIKQRGRFDPFMFSGTVFSSGGYSALYGQALSSVLALKSKGLADSTNTGGGIHFYGGTLFHAQRWEKTSIYVNGSYNNMDPFHKTFKQLTKWNKSPENGGGKIIFRQKLSDNGILKFYSNYSKTDLSFFLKDATYISENNLFELQNDNLFINASYKEYFKNNKWSLFMGSSYSKNKDIVLLDQSDMSENEELTQGKIIITNKINSATILKLGAEIHDLNICGTKGELEGNIDDKYYAGFIESEMLLLNTLALRLGFRHEYSDILNKNKLAPRISLAYKAGENCQLAIAYGKFYQVPENEFLYNKPNILNFENSTHYIANFQWMNNNRTFRIECFNKKYDQLIKNITELTNSFNNSGDGYARGVEVFWRDEKTIKNADYWISYSFLDTKRNYRDYPIQACPTFAAKHTLSIIYKQWISRISSMIGLSYSYSSGRPYYDPSKPDEKFHSDYTQSYKNLDINLSKMTTLWKRKAVIFFSFRNVLGQKHIFGYRYLPDGSGRIPIFPSSIRSFFLGCFISTY